MLLTSTSALAAKEANICKTEIVLSSDSCSEDDDSDYVVDITEECRSPMRNETSHQEKNETETVHLQVPKDNDANKTSIQSQHPHTTLDCSQTANHDLKNKLMEQKLLYYTNQNKLLQMKQDHYRQKEEDRVQNKQISSEILTVLKDIRSFLKNCPKISEKNILDPSHVESRKPNASENPPNLLPVEIEPEPQKLVSPEIETEAEPTLNGEVKQEPMALLLNDSGMEPVFEETVSKNQQEMNVEEENIKEEIKIRKLIGVRSSLRERKHVFPAWNRIETVLLIKIYYNLKSMCRGRQLFSSISNKLMELNIQRHPRDCSLKWKTLIRSYREARANPSERIRFEYFDDIDAHFKKVQSEEVKTVFSKYR
ncbi:uncharacterized protein LOC129738673 isoform X2 [Uranotaenia lowii]|uniref:uncharacterized protein LOC129738673 isoform X2 n=1 Tax=Uranotaenia lowii TaxID=190385 RepID=UPI00247A08A2|nr:uncharacterized protein LOC129738673 isoform X2 [Uranotaenia lowii]